MKTAEDNVRRGRLWPGQTLFGIETFFAKKDKDPTGCRGKLLDCLMHMGLQCGLSGDLVPVLVTVRRLL